MEQTNMAEYESAPAGALLERVAKPTAQVGLIDLYKLPPADVIGPEPIRDAAAAHQDAHRASRAAKAELATLAGKGRAEAEAIDARALADSIAAGGKDPGAKAVATFERDLAAKKRHAEALALIEQDRLRDLRDAFKAHADDWLASLDDAEDDLFIDYAAAIEQARQVADRIARQKAVRAFLNGARYNPNAAPFVVDGGDQRNAHQALDVAHNLYGRRDPTGLPKPPETVAEMGQRAYAAMREANRY